MNKKLLLAGGGILVLAVVGYFLMNQNGTTTLNDSATNTQDPEQVQNIVMGAFEGSGSIKCTYQNEESLGTAYIKNGMVRAENTTSGGVRPSNVIYKNDTAWVWETGAVEGFMMTNISRYQGSVPEGYTTDPSEIRSQIEQNRPTCNEENISDDMFNAPSDVVFTDFSSMMEDVQTQIPEDFVLPEGVELPEGFVIPSN